MSEQRSGEDPVEGTQELLSDAVEAERATVIALDASGISTFMDYRVHYKNGTPWEVESSQPGVSLRPRYPRPHRTVRRRRRQT